MPGRGPGGPCGRYSRAGALRAKNSAGRCMKEARGSVAPPSAQHVVFCGRRGRAALRVEAPGPLRCAQHAVFYGILVRSSAWYGHMPHVARQKTRGALRCTPKPRACCFLLRESSLRGRRCVLKRSAGRCMKEARGSVAPRCVQKPFFAEEGAHCVARRSSRGLCVARNTLFFMESGCVLPRCTAMPHVARQKTRGDLRCTPKPRACCFLLRESSLRGRRCVPKNSAGRCMKEARGSVAPRCVQKPFWAKEGAHCVARRIPARGNYPFFVPCGLCIRKAEAPRGGSIRVAAVFLQKSGARSCGIRKARPAGR